MSTTGDAPENAPAAAGWFSRDKGPFVDPARIDTQIADEFADHLQHLEQELINSGTPPAAAAALARRRFGDPARFARECRTIALKEHLMLKRLHLATTIILAVLLILGTLFGVSRARQARQEAEMARAMEVEARMAAEQARMDAVQSRDRAQSAEAAAQDQSKRQPQMATPAPAPK